MNEEKFKKSCEIKFVLQFILKQGAEIIKSYLYTLCRFIVKEQTIYPNTKRGIVYNIFAEGSNLTRITKGVVQEYNSQVRTSYFFCCCKEISVEDKDK